VSSFGTFLLAAVLAGCGSTLHDAFHPVFISGEDARTMLDRDAGAMLAARHPGQTVGPARCPYLMNLTGERVGTCTIPVPGGSMRIGVANGTLVRSFFFPRDIDALVVRRDAEPQLTDDLQRAYGVPFTVRCDGPPVRVLPVKEHFTCAIDAAGFDVHRLDVFADDRYGRLRFEPLKHGDTLLARTLGREAAARSNGTIVIAGARAERYLQETAGESLHGELVRRRLLGGSHCPPRIVLSEQSRARCTVRAGGRAVSYVLAFHGGSGLFIAPTRHLVVVPALQELAQRYLEHQVRPAAVTHLTCARERVITVDDEDDSLQCTATYGGRAHAFTAAFLGDDGYDVTFSQHD
jgi:hypothetical protein